MRGGGYFCDCCPLLSSMLQYTTIMVEATAMATMVEAFTMTEASSMADISAIAMAVMVEAISMEEAITKAMMREAIL